MNAPRPIDRQSDRLFAFLLSFAALAPRLYVAIAWAQEPVWDGHYYDFGAKRIAAGFGYSDDQMIQGITRWHPWCHYPVGYSAFLAALYRVLGANPHVATVANAVLGALMVAVVHRIAWRWLSPWRARIAAILCAVHPGLILFSAVVMSELLAAFVPLLALWVVVRDRRTHPWRAAVLSGLCMGIATLVTPQSILLAPVLGVVFLDGKVSWSRAMQMLKRSAIVTSVALAVVAPWIWRNCRVMDGCAFVSTNGGWNLAIGALPKATGRFETLRASDGCEVVTGQVQQDRCWAHRAWEAIRNDPVRWITLGPKKLDHCFNHESFPIQYLKTAAPRLWPEDRAGRWRDNLTFLHRLLMSAAPLGLLGLLTRKALKGLKVKAVVLEVGLWIGTALLVAYAWNFWSGTWFPFWVMAVAIPVLALVPRPGAPPLRGIGTYIGCSIAIFDLLHVVFFGEDRYHVPLIPLLCMLVAAAGRPPRVTQRVADCG